MSDVISFTKVRGSYGWLSNMSPHPITIGPKGLSVRWPTAEHLFQALRFPAGAPQREAIRETRSPMTAKRTAHLLRASSIVVPHSAQDLDNMREVLALKMEGYLHLKAQLLATRDLKIHEDVSARVSPGALFWGARFDVGSQAWIGTSWLGRLWMEQRARIRQKSQILEPAQGEISF